MTLRLSFWVKVFSFISIFILLQYAASAQDIKWNVEKVMQVQSGLNTVSFSLENKGKSDIEGNIQVQLPEALALLGNSTISASVPVGKVRYYTFRVHASSLSALTGQSIKLTLKDGNNSTLKEQTINIEVPEYRKISITDISPIQTFNTAGDSIHIKLKLQNQGTVEESFKVVLSSPNRNGKTIFKEYPVQLLPDQDSILVYNFSIEKYMTNLSQYIVRVTGINDQDDPFANLQLNFYNRSSARDYNASDMLRNNLWHTSSNNIELRITNLFNASRSYNLYSVGDYAITDGAIRYAANISRWQGMDRFYISNTYLEYQKQNHTISAGNIQETLEAPFFGRGVKYNFTDTAKATSFDAGISDGNNELLKNAYTGVAPFTAYARLRLGENKEDRKNYEGQIIYARNTADSTGSILWANNFDILAKKAKTRMTGFVGVGTVYQMINSKQENQIPSLALGWKTTHQIQKAQIIADYYYSTPYYTGNRRGVTQFQQRINYPLGSWQSSLGYNYSSYNPKSLSYYVTNFKNVQQRIEARLSGASRNGSSYFSFSPSYDRQKASYGFSSTPLNLQSNNYLLQTSLQHFSANKKHNFNLLAEGGYINVSNLESQQNPITLGDFAFRSDFSYGYKQHRLYGSIQKGTFQLYELFNSILFNREFGTQYAFGVQTSGAFFDDRMKWNIQSTGRFNKEWGTNVTNVGNIDFSVTKATTIRLQGQYTYNKGINGDPFAYNNVQIAFKQQLPSGHKTSSKPKGTVTMFAFYDNNYNGVYDSGDEIAENYNLMLGSVTFTTNKNGMASYKNLPYGQYVLFTPPSNDYSAKSQIIDHNSKSRRVEIALQQLATLQGNILLEYDSAFDLPVTTTLSNYKIRVQGEDGGLIHTLTDDDGNYMVQVPRGIYTISLDQSSFPTNIITQEKDYTITVDSIKIIKIPTFKVKAQKKKIEIKRFGK